MKGKSLASLNQVGRNMNTDPIADFLTRVRNANLAFLEETQVPFSKMKWKVAGLLKREGFIQDCREETLDDGKKIIRVWLKFAPNRVRVLSGLKRISRPGLRIYADLDDVKKYRRRFGMTVLSTSKGILSDKDALQQKIGGEVLCQVW